MVSTNTSLPDLRQVDANLLAPWLDHLCEGRNESLIRDAFDLLLELEQGKEHPDAPDSLVICDILGGLGMDSETLAAALLHQSIDSDRLVVDQLDRRFGPAIARMVLQTNLVDHFTDASTRDAAADSRHSQAEHLENLRRLLLDVSKDVRGLLIVLARQVVLMRRLRRADPTQRLVPARDTRDIFAPLANRLGVWQLKWELEDFALRYLEPDAYHEIASLLDGRREDRELYIANAMRDLREACDEIGLQAEIMGRPKHIYSIWKKMRRKQVGIDQIFDLRALRILVGNLHDCYQALGTVHGLWRFIPGEFDDYVATPKPNGYRSIHTAVIGPEDKTLEIQIRTREMHEHSELGVAAHWRYKEQGQQDEDFERRVVQMRNWLARVDDEGEPQPEQPAENEVEVSDKRQIYVFTPAGKVIELDPGSTAVDFAYAIHTEVGHRCRGALADGRIIQLNQPLNNGQVIEIITSKDGGPSRDWLSPHLNYLHSSRARNRVRQWLRMQDYEAHLRLGKAALDRELARLDTVKPDLSQVALRFNLKSADDLLAAIGRGDITPLQVAHIQDEKARVERRRLLANHIRTKRRKPSVTAGGEPQIVVDGLDDLMIHKAKCCQPQPGDAIVGFITRGQGIRVHRQDCRELGNLPEGERERLIDVEWESSEDLPQVLELRIHARDRRGLLGDLSSLISREANVIKVNTESRRDDATATLHFTLEINELAQLSRLVEQLRQRPDVIKVQRETAA